MFSKKTKLKVSNPCNLKGEIHIDYCRGQEALILFINFEGYQERKDMKNFYHLTLIFKNGEGEIRHENCCLTVICLYTNNFQPFKISSWI